MAIGGTLGQRNFPVSCERVAFSRMGVPAKQLRSWRKGMGVERKKEWDGVGEAGKASSVLGVHPDQSHSTKMLGKKPLTKKAHKKSLTSKSKV
jgi:hypothetical protein